MRLVEKKHFTDYRVKMRVFVTPPKQKRIQKDKIDSLKINENRN